MFSSIFSLGKVTDELKMPGGGRHSSSRGSAINKKLIIACAAVGFIFLYVLYSWSGSNSAGSSASGGKHLKRYHTWKTQDFVDIPTEIIDKAKSVQIDERTLTFNFGGQVIDLCLSSLSMDRCADQQPFASQFYA